MKKLLVAAVVIAAGVVAFNYLPSFTKSADVQAVEQLEDAFEAEQKAFAQAHRTAGVAGIDTSGDAERARLAVSRLQKELGPLRKRLTDAKAVDKAQALADRMDAFVESLR